MKTETKIERSASQAEWNGNGHGNGSGHGPPTPLSLTESIRDDLLAVELILQTEALSTVPLAQEI